MSARPRSLSADITPDTPGTIELSRVTAFYNLTHTGGTLGYARWSWQNHVGAPERYWIYVDQTGEWMHFFRSIPNDPATFNPDEPEQVMGNYLALAVTKEDFQKWFWCGIKLYDRYYRFQGYGCHPDWSPPPCGAGKFHPWYQDRIDESGDHMRAILEHTYGD
jgi:hypothetical protein